MSDAKSLDVRGLIKEHCRTHPDSKFFDKKTLKFFGERISEMRVLKGTVEVEGKSAYVLSTYSRSAGCRFYHFFDTETFDIVYA